MNKLILKLTDNFIYIYNCNKDNLIEEQIPKNIIKNSKIIDIEKFIEELNNIIKKNKLNNILIKNKVNILIPSYYNNTDKFLLDYTFKILNYYNYEFIKESDVYNYLLDSDNIVINLWEKQGEISYREKDKVITSYFNINDNIKKDVENIIVINNVNCNKINIQNKNIIYLEPNKHFMIYKLKEKFMSN